MQRNSKGLSIAALICGVIGIISLIVTLPAILGSADNRDAEGVVASALVFPIIGLILGLLGIIFGAVGMKQARLAGQSKGLAVGGLVCGIVGTVFSGIAVLCTTSIICAAQNGTLH